MLRSSGLFLDRKIFVSLFTTRLNKEIDFSKFGGRVAPVCLAQKNDGDYAGVDVTATGWGTLSSGGFQATVLMEVNLTTISNKECTTDYWYEKEEIT